MMLEHVMRLKQFMWHAYSKNSQAYKAAVKFYNLPKADRDAVG